MLLVISKECPRILGMNLQGVPLKETTRDGLFHFFFPAYGTSTEAATFCCPGRLPKDRRFESRRVLLWTSGSESHLTGKSANL